MCPHGNFPSGCRQCAEEQRPENIDVASGHLQFQECEPFADLEHSDQQGIRREPTMDEKEKMDKSLLALGRLFEGTGIRWQLDGALNISLMRGEYIGLHKDVDISIEADQIQLLEKKLEEQGYGLFVSYLKNPAQPRGKKVMERVDASAFLKVAEANNETHLKIAAVDEKGLIREAGDLNFIDTHVVKRVDGDPVGWGGVRLPQEWYDPEPLAFQGVELLLSKPAKVTYFKLHDTRVYDHMDLKLLAESGKMTMKDVEQVASVIDVEQQVFMKHAEVFFNSMFARLEPKMTKEQVQKAFVSDHVVEKRLADSAGQLDELSELVVSSGKYSFTELQNDIVRIFQLDATFVKQKQQIDELRGRVRSVESIREVK